MMIQIPKSGRVGTLISSSVKQIFESFSRQIPDSENLMIITRLSPRRLIRHIDLNSVDFRWLSIEESIHSIDPSLEHVNHLVNSTILEKEGLVWIDGLEYLADRQGFDAVHSFVRNIVDSVGNTKWKIIIAIEIGTFNEIEIAQIIREASEIETTIEDIDLEDNIIESEIVQTKKNQDVEVKKIKVTGLKLLTKISKEGFTQKTLRERIMQWRSMNLDVSILEPALNFQNPDDAYHLYSDVEELVRTAVELDSRLDILKEKGETAKAYAYRYRIRQLTGLDEISRIVDTLLSE
tara:strand:- start:1232 stop:2110 length:879 start_codon:yes stop_codon:yes gene_type:complete